MKSLPTIFALFITFLPIALMFSVHDSTTPTQTSSLFKIDFNLLYISLCKKASTDSATLLLYLLLHQNHSFKAFLLERTDLDQLVRPLLFNSK